MRIGAHESIAGGLWKAFGRAEADGAESLQIFTKSGRQWAAKPLTDEDIRLFRQEAARTGLPVIAHASYLLNLGAPEGEIRSKSLAALREEVERCAALGIPWLVLHPGANEDLDAGVALVIDGIRQVLDETRGSSAGICLEVTAGQGSSLGHKLEELGRMLDGIGDADRTGACLDSCHLFAAGYDLATEEGYTATMDTFEKTVGVPRLRALHLNDAKKGLGCRVDRHDHIGEGTLGLGTFARLASDPRFAGLPAVLETPEGKWPEEIALLKRLRDEGSAPRAPRLTRAKA
jgi:deoxyribonuclease-4